MLQTTDLDPATAAPLTRKSYNTVDYSLKYGTTLNDRPLYVFYVGALSSAKESPSGFPSLSDDAYIFVQYHEFDVYYEVLPKFVLTGYFGIERAQGGRFSDWGETQLPRDQTGIGIGGGFDWTMSNNTGLYFRYRHMDFNDKNFELDHYKGYEMTLEFKTFF